VFRDRDNLTSGVLNDELRNHLEASKFLVVLCSPNSAQSEWVSDEIKAFIEMGRLDKIVPFIIDGTPQDYSNGDVTKPLMGECFPLALRQWNTENPDKNLLGIAVTDDGKTDRQKAFVRLVSHLLGIEFDTLWQRHKRFLRRLTASLAALTVLALAMIYWFVIPVKMSVTIQDEPSKLPGMEQGVLNINGSEYSFSHPDTTIETSALPGYCRMKAVPMSLHVDRFYCDESSTIQIGMGIRQHVTIQLHRDSTFAVFAGVVYDGDANDYDQHPVGDAKITVGIYETISDTNGQFRITIPLVEQEETQRLSISKNGYQDFYREDESPNKELRFLLHH
jgi:hypothetical protein